MSTATPVDQLKEEHAAATVALRELQKTAVAADPSLKAKGEFFRTELLKHFRHEEEAVFPAVIALAAEGAPTVDILTQFFNGETDEDLKAHTIMRSRLREMNEILEGESTSEIEAEALSQLQIVLRLTADILQRHIAKEHSVIFPMIERLLDDAQMTLVAKRMVALDAPGA
jgi:iron-sulfur cluster repair protein YtfE (RIC family)